MLMLRESRRRKQLRSQPLKKRPDKLVRLRSISTAAPLLTTLKNLVIISAPCTLMTLLSNV
jgi:hypothetical protein